MRCCLVARPRTRPPAGPTRGEANAAFQSNFTGGFAIRTHNLKANGAPGGPAIPTPDSPDLSGRARPGVLRARLARHHAWRLQRAAPITVGGGPSVRARRCPAPDGAHRDQEVAAPGPKLLREPALGSDVRGRFSRRGRFRSAATRSKRPPPTASGSLHRLASSPAENGMRPGASTQDGRLSEVPALVVCGVSRACARHFDKSTLGSGCAG